MKNKIPSARPLLVFAHNGEAKAFLLHFKASPIHMPSLDRINLFECDQLYILLTGEGTTGAGEKLSDVLAAIPKDISKVINLGVVGALTQEFPLKTIVLVKNIYAFDGPVFHCPPLQGDWRTANLFTADKRILDANESRQLAKLAPLVDREAHGLAQTSQLYNLPFTSIKVVSDLPWQSERPASDRKHQKIVQDKASEWSTLLLEAYRRLS